MHSLYTPTPSPYSSSSDLLSSFSARSVPALLLLYAGPNGTKLNANIHARYLLTAVLFDCFTLNDLSAVKLASE